MAIETQYRQSLFLWSSTSLSQRLWIRQDSAACVSLPSNSIVKEQLSDTFPWAGQTWLAPKTTRPLPA